jgi:hypothetical protein
VRAPPAATRSDVYHRHASTPGMSCIRLDVVKNFSLRIPLPGDLGAPTGLCVEGVFQLDHDIWVAPKYVAFRNDILAGIAVGFSPCVLFRMTERSTFSYSVLEGRTS